MPVVTESDKPRTPMNSTEWKKDVREFWKEPLGEQDYDELLTGGELILARGVSRNQFLDSFIQEDDDFARGMEWRAVGHAHSKVGDIFVIRLPCGPHEIAVGALTQAVFRFIYMSASNPSIGDAIVSTGATRYTGGPRSSESDGGFRPIDSPANIAAGEAIPTLVFEVAYSQSMSNLRSKVNWWFETFSEVRHVIFVWVRPKRYGSRGHHGVGPGERPVLVWHYARTTGATPPEENLFHLESPPGTPPCPDCTEDRNHIDIGSSWDPAGAGDLHVVKTLTIPSADLFHTVGSVPVGFPDDVVVDLSIVRRALEMVNSSHMRW